MQTADALAIPLYRSSDAIDLEGSDQDVRISFKDRHSASSYDWEALFHAPLLIATQLMSAQRFEDAQRWFHTLFNPTSNDSESDAPRVRIVATSIES